ncbi:hypothetical protein ABBQ32_013957 [Trebouxia sp. C0010 RCD-2024]
MSGRGGKRARQDGGGRGGGEGGAGGGKKSKYFQANSKATLPVGSRGVLVSCIGGKEQYAAKDSIRILTEYYDKLKGTEQPAAPDTSSKPADISSAIADEVAELQNPKGQLFVHHKVNVFGLIFIGFHTPSPHPTPSEVVQAAAQDVLKTKQCLSKVCMRFMPVEGVCYAGLEDISKLGKKVLAEHFPTGDNVPVTTFGVLYEHRASDLLKRMDVINTIVDCIPQPPYKVELSNPKKTVLVEVMKATAAISVVEDYKLLGKLNLRELSMIGVEVDKKDDTLSNAAEKPEAVLAADAATKGQTLADSADPKQSNVVPSPTSKVIAPDKPEQKR